MNLLNVNMFVQSRQQVGGCLYKPLQMFTNGAYCEEFFLFYEIWIQIHHHENREKTKGKPNKVFITSNSAVTGDKNEFIKGI